jgi:hypothetical protein
MAATFTLAFACNKIVRSFCRKDWTNFFEDDPSDDEDMDCVPWCDAYRTLQLAGELEYTKGPTDPDLSANVVMGKLCRGEYADNLSLARDLGVVINNAESYTLRTIENVHVPKVTRTFKLLRTGINTQVKMISQTVLRRLATAADEVAVAEAEAEAEAEAVQAYTQMKIGVRVSADQDEGKVREAERTLIQLHNA